MISTLEKFIPGPIQRISNRWGHDKFFIKRLDLIQSWAEGNKYYKLKYNIAFALENGIQTIVSKGGMFSNHLHALAHVCSIFGIKLISVIRTHRNDLENPVLNELKSLSDKLIYLKPDQYELFGGREASIQFPEALFIPEGGLNELGIKGTKEIIEECREQHPTHIIISAGSMCTAAGLISSADDSMKIIIVPAWKGCTNNTFEEILQQFNISPECGWEIWPDAHFGGFARYDETLSDFMKSITQATGIPLDPIYIGKMMYAISEKIKQGYFSKDDSILAIHTGGIQGLKGFAYRYPEEWGNYADLIFAPKSPKGDLHKSFKS
jgi:1-aminocyclopropane-1-carboxylate deaminase